jgi:hypothetical protein
MRNKLIQESQTDVGNRYALIVGIDYYNDASHFIPFPVLANSAEDGAVRVGKTEITGARSSL